MSPVLVSSDDRSTMHGDRARHIVATVLVALALATMLAALTLGLRAPKRVGRVSVTNAGSYLVDVEIAGAARDGWLGLAAAPPRDRVDVHDVVDQGDRWVFHFTSGRHDGGEVSLARADLERAGWRVTVPPEVEARLAAQGTPDFGG